MRNNTVLQARNAITEVDVENIKGVLADLHEVQKELGKIYCERKKKGS